MKLKSEKAVLAVLLVLLVSCAAPGMRPSPVPPPISPLPVRVLLLVPYELESYVYVGYTEGREVRHPIGREGVEELSRLLGPAFERFAIKPAPSEADAMAMLSPNAPGNAEILRYDYVAIPRFKNVSSWTRPSEYGYDVDIILELVSSDGVVTEIHGHGETRTGKYSGSSPRESARIALYNAVSAIRDGIDGKRHLFQR
jgi:hypothetical protein